jgi:signal transduction histidine kinase
VEDIRPRTLLFCAALALAIGLSMLLRGRRAVHWLFAAFGIDLSLWYASQSLYGLFHGAIAGRALAVLTVLIPILAIYLFQAVVPTSPNEKPVLPRVALVLGVPMLVLGLSPYHDRALSFGVVYVYVFGLLTAALVSLWRRGRQSASKVLRERVRFLVVVGALATTFTLSDFVSVLGFAFPPISAVLAMVFLFVLAESLTRPRLAALYEMAGRLMVFTSLAFALAGIFYIFATMIGRTNNMYYNAVLAAIVFLVLFEPLHAEVEKRIHQFFFRERYDLETSVSDLRRRLSHVLQIDEMVDTVITGLDRSRRATGAAIYLRDQEGDGFDLVGSLGEKPPKRIEALTARPLLDRLGIQPSLSLEDLSRETKDVDTKENDAPALIAAESVLGPLLGSVILAVRGEADAGQTPELIGLLCVADDRVRDAFNPEEVLLLESVASQIGITLANSRIYARMKERDRLAALGAMAAGLAHEVKNPLGAIKGAAQLLEEGGPEQSSKEFIGIILEEVDRLNKVVGSFLDYARPHAGNPVPIDVNAAVRRTVQILQSQPTEGALFELDLEDDVPRVKIDAEQLRQVIMNLAQNAIQAMEGHGRVTVATALRRTGRAWAATPNSERGIPPKADTAPRVVEISVRDTGPGISQKVLENLFVPFFTTKHEGTGLGLAISQSIVQNVGGNIEVHTQSGAGTTFTVVLPAAEGALVATPMPDAVVAKAV